MVKNPECFNATIEKLMNKRNRQIDFDIWTLEDHLKYAEKIGERLEIQNKIRALEETKKIVPTPLKARSELLCYEAEFNQLAQQKYDWQKAKAFWEEFDLFTKENIEKFDSEGMKELIWITAKIRRWV